MIGLVFAGGGAKGAYQIGAWQALREHGIRFDVVAGTSIGALNATLVASDDFGKARAFWSSLTTARLARIEPLLLVGFLLRVLGVFARRTRLSQISSARQLRLTLKISAIGFAAFVLIVTVIGWMLNVPRELLLTGSIALAALALWSLVPELSELVNGALISRQALTRLTEGIVDWAKLSTSHLPVFVTMARVAERRRARDVPTTARDRTEIVPDYICLNLLPPPLAQACLTASMALPFGIFPRVEIGEFRYMDGGLADNVPVYPLLLQQCDVIYVVHLSPNPRYADLSLVHDAQLERAMQIIDSRRWRTGERGLYQNNWWTRRLQDLIQMRALFVDEDTIKRHFQDRMDRPGAGNVRIIHIVPRTRLGWGLFGTLIFNPAKTERLISLGYEDATATLEGLRQVPPCPPDWDERLLRREIRIAVLIRILYLLVALFMLSLAYYLERA